MTEYTEVYVTTHGPYGAAGKKKLDRLLEAGWEIDRRDFSDSWDVKQGPTTSYKCEQWLYRLKKESS